MHLNNSQIVQSNSDPDGTFLKGTRPVLENNFVIGQRSYGHKQHSISFILEWTKLVWTPALGLYLCGREDVHVTSNVELRNYVPLFGVTQSNVELPNYVPLFGVT